MTTDPTTDPDRRSWVPSAEGSDFPVQSLPYGVFSSPGERARIGVAIGDHIVDLAGLGAAGLLDQVGPDAAATFAAPSLNAFLARGRPVWQAVRRRLSDLLTEGAAVRPEERAAVERALVDRAGAVLHLPVEVGDYVDFYSSLDHASNLGALFRPGGDPLVANWRHLPVGYHGRAGSLVVSGTDVVRPAGQLLRPGGGGGLPAVEFGPTERLDFELEVGFVVGAGSDLGRPVPIGAVADHVFGVVLVNDWSARDVQAFEYVPLGPFLGKSFATSMSAWVVPLDALAAARVPGPVQVPEPLPYLRSGDPWGLDLDLEVWLRLAGSAEEERISRTGFAHMYWTVAQQVAHLTANGARLRPGDLLASGTVSGPEPGQRGSLIELAWNGAEPLELSGGRRRSFLEDGDEVILRGCAAAGGVRLALGEVRGVITPAYRADPAN